MYEERTYRNAVNNQQLISFVVIENESDLMILSDQNLEVEARRSLQKYREQIEMYGKKYPEFTTSLNPLIDQPEAPEIVLQMLSGSRELEVGPMAAVAGAISEYVGKELLKHAKEVIVENGGDIFMHITSPKQVRIYAGKSPFSNKLSLLIQPQQTPLGICTSSGTVGHSLSFGCADAVVVLSSNTLLADAAATRIGNMVKRPQDIQKGLDYAKSIVGIRGVLIILGNKLGAYGEIEIMPMEG